MNTTEIKHMDKTVSIVSKEEWSYDGIEMGKIRALNLDLFNEVQKAVTHYMDNKEKIEAEQAQQRKQAKFEKEMAEFTAWKSKVLSEYGKLLKGQEFELKEPVFDGYGYNAQQIVIGKVRVYYDNQVYSPRAWSSHKTNSVWCVTADYKTRRYAKIETAITKAIEKNDELMAEERREAETEARKKHADARMKEFAEAHGFLFEKEWHRGYRSHSISDGYSIPVMHKDNVKAVLSYEAKEDKVIITSYTVRKPGNEGVSVETVKALVEEVTE